MDCPYCVTEILYDGWQWYAACSMGLVLLCRKGLKSLTLTRAVHTGRTFRSVSDEARAIGGGVLEAIMTRLNKMDSAEVLICRIFRVRAPLPPDYSRHGTKYPATSGSAN